jgi:hypothetical protein
MKVEFSRQIFERSSNIKFHEDPSSGSQVIPCGRTDRQTEMIKLILAFRNFVKPPKNGNISQGKEVFEMVTDTPQMQFQVTQFQTRYSTQTKKK